MKTVDDRAAYMTGFVIKKRKGTPSVKTTPEMIERGDKRRKIEQMQADKELEEMIGDDYD